MSSFDLVDRQRAVVIERMARDLAALYDELEAPKAREKFSVARVLGLAAEGKLAGTYEADVMRAAAAASGQMFDERSFVIPWSVLRADSRRDLSVSVSSAGGNIVGASLGAFRDTLWGASAAMRLGVETEVGLVSDWVVPRVTAPIVGAWRANETAAFSEQTPTIGSTSSRPKSGGAYITASLNFMRLAQQGERFIRAHLVGAVGRMLDKALFQGSGASGEPLGLIKLTGDATAGTGLFDRSNAYAMANIYSGSYLEEGNALLDQSQVKFAAHPIVLQYIQTQKTDLGGCIPLWRDGRMAGAPFLTSIGAPTGYLFSGDWGQATIAMWGAGLRVETDPYTNFKAGKVTFRLLVDADIVFHVPEAFAVWESIS